MNDSDVETRSRTPIELRDITCASTSCPKAAHCIHRTDSYPVAEGAIRISPVNPEYCSLYKDSRSLPIRVALAVVEVLKWVVIIASAPVWLCFVLMHWMFSSMFFVAKPTHARVLVRRFDIRAYGFSVRNLGVCVFRYSALEKRKHQ